MPKRTSDCNYMPVSNKDYCDRAWPNDWKRNLLEQFNGRNHVSKICFYQFSKQNVFYENYKFRALFVLKLNSICQVVSLKHVTNG